MADSNKFNDFVIDTLLGEGGMGKVYRARQVSLERWVALKTMPRVKEDPTFAERFYREARSAARLVHPNIIQIYTVGEEQGIPYFCMEYIEGVDLEKLNQQEVPLSMEEIVEVIRAVLKALAIAIEHGIVHRDIKPANIMIDKNGLVKVMDFGLAKGLGNEGSLTQAGLVIGTPAYMSPEQGASREVDSRSDLYSVGCVMYECITRRQPFKADNVASLIYKHAYEPAEPPSKYNEKLVPAMEKFCLTLMAKDPAQRYQTPQEALTILADVPSNQAAAEIQLSRRVSKIMADRKPLPAAAPVPATPATPAWGRGASVEESGKPAPPLPSFPPRRPEGEPVSLRSPGSTPMPPARPASPTPMPEPSPTAAFAPETLPHFPDEPRPPSSQFVAPPRTPMRSRTPVPGADSVRTTSPTPRAESRPVSRVDEIFHKLDDGRWSYKVDLGHCNLAEGLAALVPAKSGEKATGLGDCLLCGNWNKRTGCVIGYGQELERVRKMRGLKLQVEISIAWCGAGRFEKAIAILENYIRNTPDDPEGYRELARVYERPDYKGKDKRRAILLNQRFADLATEKGNISQIEIQRARERAQQLSLAPSEDARSGLFNTAFGIAFQCFYRGALSCFVYGMLSAERLILARAGDIDPETGVTTADLGGALGRATSIFRRFKSEQAKKDQQVLVRKELARLSALGTDELLKDAALILSVAHDQFLDAGTNLDNAVMIRSVTIRTVQQTHQLLFTEPSLFRAEQCYELIRRRLSHA